MTERNLVKLQKIGAAVLLLLLILLPLEFLRHKIEEIINVSEKSTVAEAQNLLNNELNEFKNDLKPEVFLRKFLHQTIPVKEIAGLLQVAFSTAQGQERVEAYEKMQRLLEKRLIAPELPFKPLAISASDAELKNSNAWFSDDFKKVFKKGEHDPGADLDKFYSHYFTSFAMSSIMGNELSGEQTKIIKHFLKYNFTPEKFSTNDFYQGVLSNFVKKKPINRQVSVYFSDIYDFSNLLFYCQYDHGKNVTFGCITTIYRQSDLTLEKLLPVAVKLGQKAGIRRIFFENPDSINLNENQRVVYESLKSADHHGYIGAVIELDQNANLKKMLLWYYLLRKLLVISLALVIFRISFFDLFLPLRLRLKLIMILALVLVFPMLTGLVLLLGTMRNFSEIEKNLAENFLESRLNLHELAYEEILNRQVLNNLYFKLKFGKELEITALEKIDFQKFKDYLSFSIRSSNIFQADGGKVGLMQSDRRNRGLDRILGTHSVSALKNLGVLQDNRITRQDLDKMAFTIGLAGDVAESFDLSRVVGSEGEHSPKVSGLNSLNRANFFLFTRENDERQTVNTIGFFDLEPEWLMRRFIESSRGYPHRYFFKAAKPYYSEVFLAKRDTTQIIEEYWAFPIFRRSEEIQGLFRQAMDSRESGKIAVKTDRQRFSAWRFSELNPFIYAGFVEVDGHQAADYLPGFLLLFVPAIMFFALLLVSQLLSSLFLAPMEALSLAIKKISTSGNPAVSVEIASNDEFSVVETAFNQMTRGLVQKKHISRFVSQRLIKAIEKGSESDRAQSLDFSEMTILASDIRDFTTISENKPPETVVAVLNDYFTEMEDCIKSEGGFVDRFIGDAIIAVFLPDILKNPAENALRAACKMRMTLQKINEKFKQNFGISIENGIGIASGKAVTANLGKSCDRRDSTIIGEIVERAELLESKTKSGHFTRIIVDEKTCDRLNDRYEFFAENADGELIFELRKPVKLAED